MEYKIIRSNRKSVAIQVTKDGVIVRAPFFTSDRDVERIVDGHKKWIENKLLQLEQSKLRQENSGTLTMDEIRALGEQALEYIPKRAAYYAPIVGVKYGRITIRNQKTKWGSCSGKGNLNFNCLLMLAPPEVIDSVVVHELCHLKVMNHSKSFYDEVLRVFPDYYKWNDWLKKNGPALMMRMTG